MTDEHATLVKMASRGEPQALDSLLVRHLPALRAFIRLRSSKAIRDRESCSDLAQSVCREVLKNMGRFEHRGEAAFRAWLFTKALRKVQDRARYYKAQKRDAVLEIDRSEEDSSCHTYYADLLTPSRIAMGREELRRFEVAVGELPEEYREVISLVRIAGLSHREAALQMQRTEDSVRGLLRRALTQLSWILSRDEEGEG